MDLNETRARDVFLDVHSGLPREAPGSRASTMRALELAFPRGHPRRLLDLGCGPGAQTIDLARALPDTEIAALDRHAPFLHALRRRGGGGRIHTVRADMQSPPFAPERFDLLWCEGAAYIIGVERALETWRPLLRPGGTLAFTEAVWLEDNPPLRVRRCWTEYPAMSEVAGVRGVIEASGYELIGDFVLPEDDWWAYYEPMATRLGHLASRYAGDALAEAVLAECAEEIEVYRRYARYYGYAFFVVRRPAQDAG